VAYRQPDFHPIPSFYGKKLPMPRLEADVFECELEGIIPEELNGSLYRLGPDTQFPTLGDEDNVINGDGHMMKWRIQDGHVDYKSRYIRTERFKAEREARRRLFGVYRNPYTDDPSVADMPDRDNTGNTFAWWFNERLFALREDSHPHEIDPVTLETLDRFNFDGDLKSSALSAHGKIDPVTGEWWAFGLFSERKNIGEISLIVGDKDLNLTREETFIAPIPGMMHDFAVTREHVIFDVQPWTVDNERIKAGGPFYAYDPSLPSYWGIMPREGSVNEIRWFKAPKVHVGHIMNAYTEGSTVVLDAAVCEGNSFPFIKDINGNATDPNDGFGYITRLTFDLAGTSDEPKVTSSGHIGEMPRIDDRFAMSKHRYGYFRSLDGISRIDWETGETRSYDLKGASVAHEGIFVPRTPDAPEGDGYLLSVVNHYDTNRGELLVLDATTVDVIARAKIPFSPCFTFHGSWAPNAG